MNLSKKIFQPVKSVLIKPVVFLVVIYKRYSHIQPVNEDEILYSLIAKIIAFAFFLVLGILLLLRILNQGGLLPLIKGFVIFPKQEQIILYAQTNSGLPLRLKIPTINVDSSVEYVGLTSSGAMDVPKGPDNVAWFEPGIRPGEKGSAVIAGHFGWKNGIPAVFDNLHKLQKGDKLYIEDDKGAAITFVVREIKMYDQNADSKDVFISNDGKSHLNLITCEGVWNKGSQSYSNRLVVFADKE